MSHTRKSELGQGGVRYRKVTAVCSVWSLCKVVEGAWTSWRRVECGRQSTGLSEVGHRQGLRGLPKMCVWHSGCTARTVGCGVR